MLARRWLRTVTIAIAIPSGGASPARAESELAKTIEKVKPAVVMVGTHSENAHPRFNLFGTGFAVSNNLIATNAHVVLPLLARNGGERLVVRLPDREGLDRMRTAALKSIDEMHDLAVLSIDGAPVPYLEIGDSNKVREGASIAFTGFPIGAALGFSPVTHRGIVSAITSIAPPSPNARSLNAERVRAIKAGPFHVFQLDATAYPGNSGGPLFDTETGRVLGVINMVFVKGARESALSEPSGISYAIPALYLKAMIAGLSENFTGPPASR